MKEFYLQFLKNLLMEWKIALNAPLMNNVMDLVTQKNVLIFLLNKCKKKIDKNILIVTCYGKITEEEAEMMGLDTY